MRIKTRIATPAAGEGNGPGNHQPCGIAGNTGYWAGCGRE
jgi:hypothetical protein